ncbi:hypothetical protein EIN_135790 [Entamoeba invadens IP1]|uniref:DNA-directed RNA polymerase III subunit RPC9 n=1 Tax=Entamoeba invadens IP1 TaxID=370355 RepID=A0A0A1TXB4_ENTIV|nr:hypothetical protein EIN_135790 [Entamoeba invadens IP1]ELP85955.1 hypothetical protein EIN_135790 [Entamoeba invadens IP1]|eukprot:XP_004185301.1 hypothetical protein EIN_135790 [Entamoeba invadens IP1]
MSVERLLTNAEVMSLLNYKVKKDIELSPFEYFVYRHHESEDAKPLFRKRRLLLLAEYLKDFTLSPEEKVQIANYPPTSIVEFYSLVTEPEKFSDEQIEEFIKKVMEIMETPLDDDETSKPQRQQKGKRFKENK